MPLCSHCRKHFLVTFIGIIQESKKRSNCSILALPSHWRDLFTYLLISNVYFNLFKIIENELRKNVGTFCYYRGFSNLMWLSISMSTAEKHLTYINNVFPNNRHFPTGNVVPVKVGLVKKQMHQKRLKQTQYLKTKNLTYICKPFFADCFSHTCILL